MSLILKVWLKSFVIRKVERILNNNNNNNTYPKTLIEKKRQGQQENACIFLNIIHFE